MEYVAKIERHRLGRVWLAKDLDANCTHAGDCESGANAGLGFGRDRDIGAEDGAVASVMDVAAVQDPVVADEARVLCHF